MATDKTFSVVGTSSLDGEMKVRFANDVMRVKVLAKHGHTDITLIELDTPMSKLEAVKLIKSADEFAGVAEQMAIDDYLDRNDEKAPKVAKPVVVKAAKPAAKTKAAPKVKVSPAQDAINAKAAKAAAAAKTAEVLAEAEDAPF